MFKGSSELENKFLNHTRSINFRNAGVACIIIALGMPLGFILDIMVYPEFASLFLKDRCLCSILALVMFLILKKISLKKYYSPLLLIVPLLPAICISWMIYYSDGQTSPYYAGLSLILLGVGIVLRWSSWRSVLFISCVTVMYFTACSLHAPIRMDSDLFNNLYFLILTGVISITGNYFYNKLRWQEFRSRYELDESRRLLKRKNKKLVEIDEKKMNFFANISHELRTPLTLLVSPLEKLQKKKELIDDPDAKMQLELMQSNVMRLLKLTNDLLDLIKLNFSSMKLHPMPLDMEPFVKGLVSSIRGAAADKQITLEALVDASVGQIIADRDKFEKIILNLVFNAVKFTENGGRIDVRVRKEGEKVQIDVQDTGIGIPKDKLSCVFGQFWQIDPSAERKQQGTGIGLALVKALVGLHGGEVSVKSELGEGATFHFWIPYQDAKTFKKAEPSTDVSEKSNEEREERRLNQEADRYPALRSMLQLDESPPDPSRRTILMVDDEPDILVFAKSQIEPKYNFIGAVDGEQGLEKAKQFLPDVVLLDIMMPEKSGIEVCRMLRRHPSTKMVPIILLTAHATDETKLKALEAGANDFVSKPFSTAELHARIENLIQSAQFQRELKAKNQELEKMMATLAETESRLIQSEKLNSLGQFSAGLIHEINNPMQFISTGVYVLRKQCLHFEDEKDRASFLRAIDGVEEGFTRTSQLVSDLRTFAHPSDEFGEVPLHKVLEVACRFLSDRLKNDPTQKCTISVSEDLVVSGNHNHLVQVMMNLIKNALDAMKEKEFSEEEKATVEVYAQRVGDMVKLSVRDNGPGIPKDICDKLFDPFFTTKEVGKGMGMGLSICYRIIQKHKGTLEVESDLGSFTKFIVTLPTPEAVARSNQNN